MTLPPYQNSFGYFSGQEIRIKVVSFKGQGLKYKGIELVTKITIVLDQSSGHLLIRKGAWQIIYQYSLGCWSVCPLLTAWTLVPGPTWQFETDTWGSHLDPLWLTYHTWGVKISLGRCKLVNTNKKLEILRHLELSRVGQLIIVGRQKSAQYR